ncbi:MAG: MazG family protein [Treponema sp.]|nr:MazG family protein [Treponema sp.]
MTERNIPAANALSRLYDITRVLRSPAGCPWDKDQTPLSVRRDLMEEAFEAIDAITQGDAAHVKEELGDLVFNALLVTSMYEQQEAFSLEDMLTEIGDKLIRRHPHVFKDSAGASEMTEPVKDSGAVLNQWDRIKENVEGRRGDSVLDSVPEGFPPLLKAYKMLSKAEKKHFMWESSEDALLKVQEELDEVADAVNEVSAARTAGEPAQPGASAEGDFQPRADGSDAKTQKPFTVSGGSPVLDKAQLHLEEEIGDALLAFVNYARSLGVDASVALDRANRKFYRRFTHVEKRMAETGTPMDDAHLEDMLCFWREAKKSGK